MDGLRKKDHGIADEENERIIGFYGVLNSEKEIVLVTSPQAKEFYAKMGAIQCGEVDTLVIKGRYNYLLSIK